MKILISLEEKVTRSLIIDTGDFRMPENEDERVFEIAKIINEAKADPTSFFVEDMYSVSEERECISINVDKA